MTSRALVLRILTACALGLTACGDDDSGSDASAGAPAATAQAAPGTAPTEESGVAMSCPDVPVLGHLAEDVMATGLDCEATVPIANEAEGRSRAPYMSGGFACEPADASGGKTNYTCTKDDATLTFLYG